MAKRKMDGGRKRASRGQGRLFKKQGRRAYHADAKVAGSFYLTYTVKGERVTVALRDENRDPITDRQRAEQERQRILAPFMAADDAEALRQIKARLTDAETRATQTADVATPAMGLDNAWAAFVHSKNRPDTGPATLDIYEKTFGVFATWMRKTHPDLPALRDVTQAIADDYCGHLTDERKAAPGTFNKHVNLLSLVWRVLKKKARLPHNPWNDDDIKRKTLTVRGRREMTIEELRKVCAAATGELRLMLALGLYTGLRRGDCATLRWGEVDLVRRIILRIPNKTGRKNPRPVKIPIHHTLAAMLSEIPEGERGVYVLPETAEQYTRNPQENSRRIQAHFESCGIQTTAPGTGFEMVPGRNGKPTAKHTGKRAVVEVGFHSLRHSFVSLCRASDVPLSVVEELVGHSSPAMTRNYTHTGADAALAAVSALPSVIGKAPPALPSPDDWRVSVRALAKRLTSKTASEIKAALVALADGGAR